MGTHLTDLRHGGRSSREDLGDLASCLTPLIGEPFRFARVSYGDELTLHFADPRPGRSPKLRKTLYGSYILGLRASSWLLKFGPEGVILADGLDLSPSSPPPSNPISKAELEAGTFIEAESRVLAATPFVVKPLGAFGLQVRMTDGSTLLVIPAPQEPDGPDEVGLPELADWELSSPRGLLKAGPGLQWRFDPSAQPAKERGTGPAALQDKADVAPP